MGCIVCTDCLFGDIPYGSKPVDAMYTTDIAHARTHDINCRPTGTVHVHKEYLGLYVPHPQAALYSFHLLVISSEKNPRADRLVLPVCV